MDAQGVQNHTEPIALFRRGSLRVYSSVCTRNFDRAHQLQLFGGPLYCYADCRIRFHVGVIHTVNESDI